MKNSLYKKKYLYKFIDEQQYSEAKILVSYCVKKTKDFTGCSEEELL